MKLLRAKIDPLLVFLTLAMTLILLSDSELVMRFFSRSSSQMVQFVATNQMIQLGGEGANESPYSISTLNPDDHLVVSFDGGDTWSEEGNSVNLLDVRNASISEVPISPGQRGNGHCVPSCKNLVVYAENTDRTIRTEPVFYNAVPSWGSSLPVVCLTMKRSDLFDEKKGMMIYGETSWEDNAFFKEWWYRSANFAERGQEWERQVNVQYFENGKMTFEQNCGARISGNATRFFPQKSLRLYARSQFGKKSIKHPFWSDASVKQRSVLLRNGGNDHYKTLFADLFIQKVAADMNVFVLQGRPVSVFLNGNYWGLYTLQQRIESALLASIYDCKEEDITILDAPNATLKEGDDDIAEAYVNMVEEIQNNPTTENYEKVMNEIDAISFIDYVVLETFMGNVDWPENNCTWFKAEGQPWVWIVYDSDVTMAYQGESNLHYNHLQKFMNGTSITADLFNALMTFDDFKSKFRNRAMELIQSSLSAEKLGNIFLETKELYRTDMEFQICRWRALSGVGDWEDHCKSNLDFISKRQSIYLQHLESIK